MKLCLGTVQFGMDYGVFNQKKKDEEYCIKCLDYATQNGISAIDTATAYGTAEYITGKFLEKKTISREKLFLSTKLLPNILDEIAPLDYERVIFENLEKSLKTLHTDYVDAYFLHSSRYAHRSEILEALFEMKKKGLAKHVGVSIYDPEEALACYESSYVDYIQAPYSIFDHRMKEAGVFDNDTMGSCQIDVRTAFIKGLIRLRIDEVPEYLNKAKPILERLDILCEKTGYTRVELAMGYIKREKNINHLVFGIRDLEQLEEDICSFEREISEDILRELDEEFKEIDTDIVVPSLWKK